MKVVIHTYSNGEIDPKYAGYIETDIFDAEKCWNLCNWTSWAKKKPENLYSDIGLCSHGICFTNPDTKEKWLALTSGWLVGNDTDITEYIKDNKDKAVWI